MAECLEVSTDVQGLHIRVGVSVGWYLSRCWQRLPAIATYWDIGGLWWPRNKKNGLVFVHMCICCDLCVHLFPVMFPHLFPVMFPHLFPIVCPHLFSIVCPHLSCILWLSLLLISQGTNTWLIPLDLIGSLDCVCSYIVFGSALTHLASSALKHLVFMQRHAVPNHTASALTHFLGLVFSQGDKCVI